MGSEQGEMSVVTSKMKSIHRLRVLQMPLAFPSQMAYMGSPDAAKPVDEALTVSSTSWMNIHQNHSY